MISGGEAMVRCLLEEKVELVFGYPGATITPFYDKLSHAGIRHILTRTEQGAGHSANGYARITGRPGVCIATSGPGATNLFTALATAYSDSIPLIAITGQVSTRQLGHDVFQEVDTTGAAEAFTKYAYLVSEASQLPRIFKEAFHIASTGRRGPVLIDVPVDVQESLLDFSYPETVSIRGYKPRFDGHALQIKKVADAIRTAKKPLICCGGGVLLADGAEEVRAFCEEGGIPAVSTMMGIGALPPGHPLYFGMLGRSGHAAANKAVAQSDLLVIIGARVGDRAIARPDRLESSATIVHIDIDTAEIGKNLSTTIPLVGDAARVVRQLRERRPYGHWTEWTEELAALREADESATPSDAALDPNRFVRALCARLPEGATYVADVGLNQIWSARNFAGNGRFLTSGGMGTMGYSIPAAVGAKLADPGHTVVAVCGDGAFQMSMNELATAIQHGAPIKLVVMRNNELGMVREIQDVSFGGNHMAVDLGSGPDLGLIAAAYGIPHAKISRDDQIEEALSELLANDGPFLLECAVAAGEGTI